VRLEGTKKKGGETFVDPLFMFTYLSRPSEWYADSGASQHMTDQRSLLTNFTVVEPGRWAVFGIAGTRLDVTGHGDVILTATVGGKTLTGNRMTTLHNTNVQPYLFILFVKG